MLKTLASVTHCLIGAFAIVIAPWLHGQTVQYRVTRTLVSPGGAVAATVAARDTQYGPIFSLASTRTGSFQPFIDLPRPVYRREYHGSDWFQTMPERWIDDRFLVFQDRFGLAIADVQNRRLLIDHVFTVYEKCPTADKWVAIRFRPMGRDQELLSDDFQDTILLIDPYDVANRIGNATDANFVGQMTAVNPGGVVLGKPEWAPDGSNFGVLTWNGGKVEAVRYDRNLNETGRATVNLQVDREMALSPSSNSDIAATAKTILSDPATLQPPRSSQAP
jgi:hypothetical protein